MRFVIASANAQTLAAAEEKLAGIPGVEFRQGMVPETWAGCDAMIMWWPLAHERYGGLPVPGTAQILYNERGDDLPDIILATPSGPGMTSGVGRSEAEIEDYVFSALDACLREFRRQFPGDADESRVLIHLQVSGFDLPDMDASFWGMSRVLAPGRESPA